MPLVSIITVTKNCKHTIERTLCSIDVIKQENIQYIVMDGNSTDGTLELLKKQEKLIDILISENDTGIYNAMNKSIELATGKYILFINGDDELIADGFKKAIQELGMTTPDVLCCSSIIGSDNEKLEKLVPQPIRLFFYNSIPHPSTFVLTKILKKYNFREDLKIASDYDFFLRIFLKRKNFHVKDFVTAIHHKGGISSDSILSQREIELVKKNRLGVMYFLITGVHWIYRSHKKLFLRFL